MKRSVCTFVLWLAFGGVASAADTSTCLPPLEELVKARLALVGARQQKEQDKEEVARQNNKLINKLFIDRFSGTYSYGKGFTVDSKVDGSTGKTLVQSSKSNSAWTLSYTLPLSAFTDMHATEAKVKAEEALLQEKQELEKRDEALKINLQYGDFLEARAKLLSLCEKRDSADKDVQCLPLVFQARKVAVSLLCSTSLKARENCPEWDALAKEYALSLKAGLSCVN